MASLSLNQFLILYTWFPLAALLFFLLLIARFYQKFSGERTFFRFFAVPVVLFGAAVVRYASINRVVEDPVGDFMLAGAGVLLIVLCVNLYRRMIWRRDHQPKD